MHRTQIYLPEELHERIKNRSRVTGLSQSELIRRAIEKDLQQESLQSLKQESSQDLQQKDSQQNVREFFNQLQPLTSFSDCEPEETVVTTSQTP